MKFVDLRSDTVTKPTAEMYEAMSSAPLGDDVLGDDPTVIELEQESAGLMGMEAAMFVPSGTMGNQIALVCHTERGDCALFDEEAHMVYYEVGAPGVIAQVVTRTCPSSNGIMDPAEIEKRIQVSSLHTPGTTLVAIENTHLRSGGTPIPLSVLSQYRSLADRHQFRLHLDGARVFNACTALAVEPREVAGYFDSVNFCLSKALGAPVGSVLCGKSDFIQKARKWRKRLGGGMRQAGVLAACGLVGLRQIRHQLGADHTRARGLAEGLQGAQGMRVDLSRVVTNIVLVDTDFTSAEVCAKLETLGVRALPFGDHRVRCVFHYDVDDEGVDQAIAAFRSVS